MKRFTTAMLLIMSMTTLQANAEGSSYHSGQASKHSALAASEGAASTAKVASAAVAVPVLVVGAASVVAGSAAVAVGDSIADSARRSHLHKHHHHHQTIVITERTITADPAPSKVIKKARQR